MTQTPPPTPGPTPGATPAPAAGAKVTELEKQLAEAAAQVAKVQAELSQARAADPNLPDVPVPYSGNAPVVMINGQQVPAGQAVDISAMLGGFFGGAGAAAGATVAADGSQVVNIPPVVTVNGQVVSSGQPIDLASVVGPAALAQIRSSLDQLGLGGQLAGLFGTPASPSASPPPSGSWTQPGPAPAVYSGTPGEVTDSGNKGLVWLAALLVIGIIGVVAYLVITG
ncbi:hypothetical protein [Nocardioides dilutus]